MPNPWDVGSAKLLASLGFEALATTSAGLAWSLGKLDMQVTRDELVAHVARIAAATPLPLNVDSERCFPDEPGGVAETVRCSPPRAPPAARSRTSTRRPGRDRRRSTSPPSAWRSRPRAAPLVLTARAENHLHGVDDLDDTIARLRAYRDAGADVVYAPGLADLGSISAIVEEVGVPVNVLALPHGPSVAELEAAGVRRVSTGGALARAAYGALLAGARELRDAGTSRYSAAGAPMEASERPSAAGRLRSVSTGTERELWGGETRKAVANFPVSGEPIPVPVARWLGRIKAAAARANAELGLLDVEKAERIAAAGDAIARGEHDDQFPIDVFQTGSGTSSNMNANEVIASLAGEDVHANDDVNMGQSSNDVFPSAVHLAALGELEHDLLPALETLAASLGGEGEGVRRRRQVRPHAPDGRRPGHARPGVRRLRRAGPGGDRARPRQPQAARPDPARRHGGRHRPQHPPRLRGEGA